jgi:hypothetical protein
MCVGLSVAACVVMCVGLSVAACVVMCVVLSVAAFVVYGTFFLLIISVVVLHGRTILMLFIVSVFLLLTLTYTLTHSLTHSLTKQVIFIISSRCSHSVFK